MFPLWEMVVEPIVKAARPRRLVEIGALRGETTVKTFGYLPADAELHVIDPLPQFDPADHEREFPGRYHFHRALSLDALPDLPAMDLALVDGDHNWYTVHNELALLSDTARAAGRPLPILVVHDVGWPYGHRDLYYDPSTIPDEFRQPYARRGMAPGFVRLFDDGGINADLCNAIEGGGPRNGVMRALDDFLESYDRPVTKLVVPIYYGLAIVVEQSVLDSLPDLAAHLRWLESPAGRLRLMKLAERIRLDGLLHERAVLSVAQAGAERNRDRYLELLKAALLDEHYLENEVRLEYLLGLKPGAEIDSDGLRDPVRSLPVRYQRLERARQSGVRGVSPVIGQLPYTDMGPVALDQLRSTVLGLGAVVGDLVECGVGRGGGGIFLKACLDAHGMTDRTLWLVDRFLASDPAVAEGDTAAERFGRHRADLNQVRDGYHRFGVLDESVRFVVGSLPDSLVDAPIERISVLRIGMGARPDLEVLLDQLGPRVGPGGTVVVEGAAPPAVRRVIDAHLDRYATRPELVRIDDTTVTWTVVDPAPAGTPIRLAGTPRRAPIPTPVQGELLDLSVVVVFYNMQREARRTLHSLSRAYQRNVDDLSYEVIVIDNGSAPDQRLDRAEVESYGPEFRLVDLAGQAVGSPTVALNLGINQARGQAVALMIDGAHLLTPGVFHLGLKAMATYAPAIVATQQWYTGPGQQTDAGQTGYDQTAEDALFRRIQWPADGYRLFEIGHFIGDRDWFDGIVESNCLFVPRSLLEQVGAFDDSFSIPGGGYTNLELFERLGEHPGVTAASLLGEGSFHQFHGGTTTNVVDEGERRRRIFGYRDDFAALRGRGLIGLSSPVHYLGSMDTKAARRTRSRRELALAFDPRRDPVATTGAEPAFVPDELKLAAIEAIWDHQAWRDATWLGHPVNRYPADLHAYQELLSAERPAWVVILGDDEGLAGRALFAATVADGLGSGRVIAVGTHSGKVPDHARIEVVDGAIDDPAVVDAVRTRVDGQACVVLLGVGAVERVVGVFGLYEPLVLPGGYVVVENTVVNGRPVASSFGPGPHEGVVHILGSRTDWVPDVACEKYTVTFNKGGFLRRLAPV